MAEFIVRSVPSDRSPKASDWMLFQKKVNLRTQKLPLVRHEKILKLSSNSIRTARHPPGLSITASTPTASKRS